LFLLGILVLSATLVSGQVGSASVAAAAYFGLIGAVLVAGCFLGLRRRARAVKIQPLTGPSSWEPPPPTATAAGQLASARPAPDAEKAYQQWFRWAEVEIGGDSTRLHGAVMAALQGLLAGGNTAVAADAARRAASPMSGFPKSKRIRKAHIRMLARIGSSVLPILTPGERVFASVFGGPANQAATQFFFGAVFGRLISTSYFVTLTDQRVIAVMVSNLTGRAIGLEFAEPRAQAEARYRRSWLGGGLLVLSRLPGGRSLKVVLARAWRSEGMALAAALATPSMVMSEAPAAS
jgi:hypothetical protein